MDNIEESSETNLVIVTNKYRLKLFIKLYWRTILIFVIPLLLLPVAFLGFGDAYKCFYVFLLVSAYWLTDVMHPVIVSLVPVATYSLMGIATPSFIASVFLSNDLINCMGTIMLVAAIEESSVNRRIALIILMRFGCSHYRLSFLLFFSCMFISMWVSNVLACGLMMPIVKAILVELEKMGILDMYHMIDKNRQQTSRHQQKIPKPTDFTVFYFLGLAYSSTLGGIATLTGSNTNDVFKYYFESYFPEGPNLEFPHFMLLNLPAVLLMESLLYLWLNFFFMGMFRSNSAIALQIGISEEEGQYIHTLMSNQYKLLGRISFYESVVASIVILNILTDAINPAYGGHKNMSSITIVCAVLLFVIPVNLEFLKFIRRRVGGTSVDPLPKKPTNGCLNWNLVRESMLWGVLFILAASCTVFENMLSAHMNLEFERFLLYFSDLPAMALALVIIIFCKTLTEFATNHCVAYMMLPCVARVSVLTRVNPIYLMSAATISSSLPFNLITGTPANAMVVAYVNMPHYKMIQAGIGPTLFSILITWTTVTVWSTTIWPDVTTFQIWARNNRVFLNVTM